MAKAVIDQLTAATDAALGIADTPFHFEIRKKGRNDLTVNKIKSINMNTRKKTYQA